MKKKFIPPLILLVLLLGIGFYFFFSRGGSRGLVLRGVVEGTTYSQIAELPGKITEMNLTLGAPVKAGDPVARLDSRDQQYALEQQQIALAKGRLALRILQKGARQEELQKARNDVSIAEANYRSAQATYNQARDDVEALPALVEAGGLAKNALDQATLKKNTASGALEAARSQAEKAREQLALLQKGADEETIAMAEEDIKAAESRVRQMQDTLGKYKILANCDGTVISVNYNSGSMVNPGYNLADISADNEKYAVCYVPKEESMRLSCGQTYTVRAAAKEYQGEVRFIDVKSQYTPKDMQTSAMKNKISVKVKLLLPAGAALRPGNTVEVVFK